MLLVLLELAIGDAYGAGFEYAPERLVRERNDLTGYIPHPRHSLAPGRYTDDTQMTIAVVEAMLSGREWTAELLASSFVDVFRRDPRQGYSKRTYGALSAAEGGADFLARLDPVSDTSGAAMRAAPIGLYRTTAEVLSRCGFQAALTHNTPDGIRAAQAASLMSHYTHYRLGPKRKVPEFLSRYLAGDWNTPWHGKVGHPGIASVRAALTALLRCERMSDLLRTCVDFTGDVDTVATIALAAGACCTEMEQDLPAVLYAGLEREAFGYEYLVELDRRLVVWAAK
jgi:ADP-ribosyl-[dinitrogen reductase] hydrolase